MDVNAIIMLKAPQKASRQILRCDYLLQLLFLIFSFQANLFSTAVNKKNVEIKTSFILSVCLCGEMRSAEDNRLCASHLFSPIHIFPHTATASLGPNILPLPLKLEYINKSCLHINSCWCTRWFTKTLTMFVFFSKSMYHLRLIISVHCGHFLPCRHMSNLSITKKE